MILAATNTGQPVVCQPAQDFRRQAGGVGWRLAIVFLACLLVWPYPGFAQGEGADSNRSLLEQFGQAARQGDAVAQTNLGAMYLHGVGVRRNLNKAFFWFQRAAEQEEGLAQFNLGVLCQEGQGIPKDDQKAVYWFRRVATQSARADQFNPVIKGWAQLKLGFSYYEGRGVKKDYQEAMSWFKLAAARGIVMAQEMLGQMYAQGQGGPQDERRAFFWYEQAARQGSRTAEKVMQEFSSRLTLAQQSEARAIESPPSADAGTQPPSGLPAQLAAQIPQKGVPLTVQSTPADAQVRILNIRPVYTPGMHLEPGKYHLEVSRTGFRPEKMWVTVQDSAVKVDVTLTPEGSTAAAKAQTSPPTQPTGSEGVGHAKAAIVSPGPAVVDDTVAAIAPKPAVAADKITPAIPKPAVTTDKVAAVAPKPAVTTDKVAAVAPKPAVAADKAAAVAPKPAVAADKITPAIPKPAVTTDKVATVAPKPAVTTDKAATVAPKPAVAADKITPAIPKPAVTTDKVATVAPKPATRQKTVAPATGSTPVVRDARKRSETARRGAKQALTVQTEPADAWVKVLDVKPVYRPGLLLDPGTYRLAVGRAGFETQHLNVTVADQAKQVAVALTPARRAVDPPAVVSSARRRSAASVGAVVDEACPVAGQPDSDRPRRYALHVQSDPADAHVQILNSKTPYQPGIPLSPGRYHLAIAKERFKTRQCWAEIVNQDLDLAVALQPVAAGDLHALTVKPQPADARVRILNIRAPYRPGIPLESGSYRLEVSKPGYKTENRLVTLGSRDLTVSVRLTEVPLERRPTLTVVPVLQGVTIRILNADVSYRPGLPLPPGNYLLELAKPGFKTQQRWVELSEQDLKIEVALEEDEGGKTP
ncbi:MAG: SEL1-like repeat protein [Magnetococcales bacterium]|nr:SEL1-like repeat protein [Magnetococcales bacterium]